MVDDRKSSDSPKAGAISPELEPADPSYWDELLERVRDGWMLEVIGEGKRYEIGRFEGIRMLGEGGFGLVLLVRDPELDREVALKLLRVPQPGKDEAMLREAQLLAKISHPNVITVHETGRHGDDVFYVMERIVGMNGHKFIAHSKSWKQVLEVYIQAGTGLAVAHEHGIVHGDFKPGNILIPEDGGAVRVADFGLAQVMYEDGEGVRHRLGTLPYTAPEVLRGEPGDARADQWSFCVSLWQSLERVLPFEGATVSELLADIELGEPQAIEPWVPPHVRTAVLRGLSLEPAERYPDMRTLIDELAKLVCTPSGTMALGNAAVGGSHEPDERLLNLPSTAGTRSVGRLLYVFLIAVIGGAVPTIVGIATTRSAVPPAVDASGNPARPSVPIDPFVAIMARVRSDDFAEVDKLWRETWSVSSKTESSEPKRSLSVQQYLTVALACIERAKQLEPGREQADDAVAVAFTIAGFLKNIDGRPSAPAASNEIEKALAEYALAPLPAADPVPSD